MCERGIPAWSPARWRRVQPPPFRRWLSSSKVEESSTVIKNDNNGPGQSEQHGFVRWLLRTLILSQSAVVSNTEIESFAASLSDKSCSFARFDDWIEQLGRHVRARLGTRGVQLFYRPADCAGYTGVLGQRVLRYSCFSLVHQHWKQKLRASDMVSESSGGMRERGYERC